MPIKPDQFDTVSDELLEAAVTLANAKRRDGYTVTIEPNDIFFPSTPALKLYRRPATIYVEMGGKSLPKSRLMDWAAYAKSCSAETRICYCTNAPISDASDTWLRKQKIGLIRIRDGELVDQIASHDLALPLGMPPKSSLKVPVRNKLARAYEKHEQGDWRGAFEEACKAFENACRRYLLQPQVQSRVLIQTSSARPAAPPDPAKVERMTLGQLGDAFSNIVGPNQIESRMGKVLKAINPDRITVAHGKRAGEAKLRRNVGKNMMAIISCMKEM